MKIKAGDQIATMGVEAENVGWPPHTHFQLLTDLCGMGLDVHGVAPRDEVSLWRSISPNPNLILRIKEGTDAHGKVSPEVIRNQRDTVLSQNLSLNFRTSLQIVKGEGAYLFDQTGKKYLDLVNNVAHVGHGHPRVVAAGASQMATLNTNTRYLHQNIVEYGRALTSTLPDPLTVIFFVNSGSEANNSLTKKGSKWFFQIRNYICKISSIFNSGAFATVLTAERVGKFCNANMSRRASATGALWRI